MADPLKRYGAQQQIRTPGDIPPRLARPLDVTGTAESRQTQELGDNAVQLGGAGLGIYSQVEAAKATETALRYQRDLAEFEEKYKADNQGEQALGAGDAFRAFAEGKAREYSEALGGGKASQLFTRHAGNEILRHSEKGMGYAAQQKETWLGSVRKGALAQYEQTVAANWDNPEYLDNQNLVLKRQLADMAPGMDHTALNAEIDRITVGNRIGAMLTAGRTGDARELLETHGKLLGASYDEVAGRVRSESIVQESLPAALKLLDEGGGGGDATQIREKVRTLYGGDQRMMDAVWGHVRQELALRKQERAEAEQGQLDATLKALFQETDPRKRLDIVNRYSGKHFAQVITFAEHLNKPTPAATEGAERKDLVVNARLRSMVDTGQLNSEEQVLFKAAEMGITDISKAKDAVEYWRGGGGKVKDSDLHGMFKELTGNAWDKKPEQFATAADFVRRQLPPEGRTPDATTVRKAMAQALMKDDSMFGAKTYGQHLAAGGDPEAFVPDISKVDRKRIEGELRDGGQRVTEQNIRDMYLYSPRWMGLRKSQRRTASPTGTVGSRERR
ncbi:hypothetical protein DA2_3807 [Desulfovibrio sp. A2]|nr:hypothetical protein DA2_3807 [Desulfovibrio sp. A2]